MQNPVLKSLPLVTALLLLACGQTQESLFDSEGNPINGDGEGRTAGTFNGSGAGGSNPSSVGITEACASSTASAKAGVAYLVFQFDRSGSMGKTTDPKSNISTCKKSLETFFSDPGTQGFQASLSLFPQEVGNDVTCTTADYAKPVQAAELQALPSAALSSAAAAIETVSGTPTIAALRGAHEYAKTISASKGGARVAIVLVTDGKPSECEGTYKTYPAGTADAPVQEVADFASTVKDTFPTYVIGIGSKLTELNLIAKAGSGRDALLVDTADPAKVTSDFFAALKTVQVAAASCDLALPEAKAGSTLDFQKVNVLYTSGAEKKAINYSDCSNGTGWKYDNQGSPTKIILCPQTCGAVKADPNAKLDLVLGCKTTNGSLQ